MIPLDLGAILPHLLMGALPLTLAAGLYLLQWSARGALAALAVRRRRRVLAGMARASFAEVAVLAATPAGPPDGDELPVTLLLEIRPLWGEPLRVAARWLVRREALPRLRPEATLPALVIAGAPPRVLPDVAWARDPARPAGERPAPGRRLALLRRGGIDRGGAEAQRVGRTAS